MSSSCKLKQSQAFLFFLLDYFHKNYLIIKNVLLFTVVLMYVWVSNKETQLDLDQMTKKEKKSGNITSPAFTLVLMISRSKTWLQLLNHCVSFEPAEVRLGNRS